MCVYFWSKGSFICFFSCLLSPLSTLDSESCVVYVWTEVICFLFLSSRSIVNIRRWVLQNGLCCVYVCVCSTWSNLFVCSLCCQHHSVSFYASVNICLKLIQIQRNLNWFNHWLIKPPSLIQRLKPTSHWSDSIEYITILKSKVAYCKVKALGQHGPNYNYNK